MSSAGWKATAAISSAWVRACQEPQSRGWTRSHNTQYSARSSAMDVVVGSNADASDDCMLQFWKNWVSRGRREEAGGIGEYTSLEIGRIRQDFRRIAIFLWALLNSLGLSIKSWNRSFPFNFQMLRMSSETASANGGLLSARPYDLFSQRGDSILGISPFWVCRS